MNFYKVSVVYNERHRTEDIFNDESAARAAFAEADRNPHVWGAKLYNCEFKNGRLETTDCIVRV
jgi:hypothetical protein